ncbi:late competence development ComFB family protein [Oribacterium sp. P6A1]|uniref:late competence development ComFB family protein n=1 Tax=Oribacterium sp. P6A1 TaxID=1410612 RepID=UPI000690747D|nr:late competence development ComFB family protein [Oribacterium sp. P6A1]
MGIESMEENNDRKDMFDTAGDAADFAENIAATIRKGLKEASESVKKEDLEAISVMLGRGTDEDHDEPEAEDMQEEKYVKNQKKSKKVVGSKYGNAHAYGIDNIELRNEVVQDKRRAIRVESAEESNVLSDAIQKHLEESVFGEAKIQEGFHIVNIMQECLKSENILEYMQNMSCCTCERCQADVLAATLSHLPAKYVVMYKKSTNARISFYHDNYKMDILSSIMRAIRDVKEHPHHGNDRIQ